VRAPGAVRERKRTRWREEAGGNYRSPTPGSGTLIETNRVAGPFANLHTHSHFSDGLTSPARLVATMAGRAGPRVFALTDHDSLSGIEPVFRCLAGMSSGAPGGGLRFIPGVELSLREPELGLTVHLLGLFPRMTPSNHSKALSAVDAVLGPYCRTRCRERGARDLDDRVRVAYEMNLEGLGDRFGSADEVIALLHGHAEVRNRRIFEASAKPGDVIQHPVPVTYQVLLDRWTELLPHSSREKAELFVFRPDPNRIRRLTALYQTEGVSGAEARDKARCRAGILARWTRPAPYADILEGLGLLKRAGAVTILAHPAASAGGEGMEAFDRLVTFPLIRAGMDGIEVLYPYASPVRGEAERHYGSLAEKHGLLVSGGTDYHGDGRVGADDVRLPLDRVDAIDARADSIRPAV